MKNKYFEITEMIEALDFQTIHLAQSEEKLNIYSKDTNRPGLQLAGFFSRFDSALIQIISDGEWYYLKEMDSQERRERLERLFSTGIPAVIFTNGNYVFDDVVELGEKYDVTILKSDRSLGRTTSDMYTFSSKALAPSTVLHGVFVEIYGKGVLITGESGAGKSETALDLLSNGHKLVSDDIINVTKTNNVLIGRSPEVTKHFMEIRGVGMLDIDKLYGFDSVKDAQVISLVVDLVPWNNKADYDRLGIVEEHTDILGMMIPTITIPIKPGRNTALIIEVATKNMILKQLGYNAAEKLDERVGDLIAKRRSKNKTKT